MVNTSVVIFNTIPPPIPHTANDIGCQLACDSADKQAAMLLAFACHVKDYGPRESWPMQCRMIAEHLLDESCWTIREVLLDLIDHLEAVPAERLAKRTTDKIVGAVAEVIGGAP